MFKIARGATKTFTGTATKNGVAVDITGARIYFTVRVADVVVLAKANTAGGGSDAQIEITNGPGGIFKVKFTNTDTSIPPIDGTCDCFVVTAAGEFIQATANERFRITQAMTRAFPTP